VRWTLRYSRDAVTAIYQIPREIWIEAKLVVWSLQDDPLPATAQPDEEDPSVYWIALPGDYIAFYEILDEHHAIRILDVA
jgi:hypothetical protein